MSRQQIIHPVEQIQTVTPAPPPVGSMKLYPKSDSNFYKLDSTGVEVQLGGTAVAAPNEVEIGPVDPRDQSVELWYDTRTDPGVLKVNVGGTWTAVSSGTTMDPWMVDANGNLIPNADNTYSIGAGTFPTQLLPLNISLQGSLSWGTGTAATVLTRSGTFNQPGMLEMKNGLVNHQLRIYGTSVDNFNFQRLLLRDDQIVTQGGGAAHPAKDLTLGTEGDSKLIFETNFDPRWEITPVGNLQTADGTHDRIDIGDATHRPLNLYLGRGLVQYQQPATPTVWPPTGNLALYPKADNNYYSIDSLGVERRIGTDIMPWYVAPIDATLPNSGALLATTDRTHNIGEVDNHRPYNVYVGQFLQVGDSTLGDGNIHAHGYIRSYDGLDSLGQTYLRGGVDVWNYGIRFRPDNSLDLGMEGGFWRPRNVYMGGFIQQAQIQTPVVPPTMGSLKLYPKSDGNFYSLDPLGVERPVGGAGGDEIWVGPDAPTGADHEMWYDVDAVSTSYGEVEVGPDDPYTLDPTSSTELWYDTQTTGQLMIRVGDDWLPAIDIPPNEVWIGDTTPNPDVELWHDTTTDPGVLKARVNGVWQTVSPPLSVPSEVEINVTEPTDPGVELWFDPDDVPISSGAVPPGGLTGRPLRKMSDVDTHVGWTGDLRLDGNAFFDGTNLGVTFNGGSGVYSHTDKPLTLREGTNGSQPRIINNDGGGARDIIDTTNGDARYSLTAHTHTPDHTHAASANYSVSWQNGFTGTAQFRVNPYMVSLQIKEMARSTQVAENARLKLFDYPSGVSAPWAQLRFYSVAGAHPSGYTQWWEHCWIECNTDGVWIQAFDDRPIETNERISATASWAR